MSCKGAMCTEKHLGIDTAQVKTMCKSIIKLCDEEPHAVDSLLEQAYIELSVVGLKMKQSADRARAERERFDKKQGQRKSESARIPELAVRYPTYLTSTKMQANVQRMLEDMDPTELDTLMARVNARRT